MLTCPNCKAKDKFALGITLFADVGECKSIEDLDLTINDIEVEVDETNVMWCKNCDYKSPVYFFLPIED